MAVWTDWLLGGVVLGLPVGPTCLVLCAPLAATSMLAAGERGLKGGARNLASFLLGRFAGYVAFGMAAGALGQIVDWNPRQPLVLAARGILSALLIVTGLAAGRSGWFERHLCAATTAAVGVAGDGRRSRLVGLPLVLGFLSGFNVCPPFLLALGEVLGSGGWLQGGIFFSGFFVGTSVWLVPLAALPVAWTGLGREGLVRLARGAAIIVGAAFLCRTVVAMRPARTAGAESAEAVCEMFPDAADITFIPDNPPRYEVKGNTTDLSPRFFVALGRRWGFSGPVPVLTAIDQEGVIVSVRILPNRETPSYIRKVDNEEVLSHFVGKSYADELSLLDLDAVTGATVSAAAVSGAVRRGARKVAVERIGLPPAEETAARPVFPLSAADVVAALYVVAVAVFFLRARSRPWTDIARAASVVVLGIAVGRFVSVADWARALSGSWPPWRVAAGWYVFLGLVVLVTFLRGRIYCTRICPFGAACTLLGRIPAPKLGPTDNVFRALRSVRWILLAATLLAFAYAGSGALFAYEPFGPTFDALSSPFRGNVDLVELASTRTAALGLAGLVLAVSVFVPRFWCRFICPAGAGIDIIANASPFRVRAADARLPVREDTRTGASPAPGESGHVRRGGQGSGND